MESANVLEEARKVNSTLSRVQQTLSWSVQQAQGTSQVLNQDHAVLDDALTDHKIKLKNALHSTRKRLDGLQFSEQIERVGIRVSVCIFTAVIVFILLSRLRVLSLVWSILFCGAGKHDHTEM